MGDQKRFEKLLNRIQTFVSEHQMIQPGDCVAIGVSGGADSVCLLRVLCLLREKLECSLTAVHVEHGIRGAESLADAAFVQELCETLQVPLLRYSVDAPARAKERHQSLEETARELRYERFREACRTCGADCLAVAHHGDDCAETMLFHLSRGTGIRGLVGIAPKRALEMDGELISRCAISAAEEQPFRCDLAAIPCSEASAATELASRNPRMCMLIRPLLCLTRIEIEEMLSFLGQEYRTDSTNADLALSRNKIRGEILPVMRRLNTAAIPHMVRTAGELEEIWGYMEAEAEQAAKRCVRYDFDMENAAQQRAGDISDTQPTEIRIDAAAFSELPNVLQRMLLHRLLGELAGQKKDLTAAHVQAVQGLFFGLVGKEVHLPYGIRAKRDYEEVVLEKSEKRSVPLQVKCGGQENIPESGVREGRLAGSGISGGPYQICDAAIPGTTLFHVGTQTVYVETEIFLFDRNSQQIPGKTYTKWFDYDKINSNVQIRTRRPGDYLQVQPGGGHKKLKDYLIDSKVPRSERDQMPLLADGSHVMWILGRRISEAYKVTQETTRILAVQVRMGGSDRA